jgi:hypothetical protein
MQGSFRIVADCGLFPRNQMRGSPESSEPLIPRSY